MNNQKTIDILLLGSGGREHALAAKLAESPLCGTLYIAPGNGGTLELGENVALDAEYSRRRGGFRPPDRLWPCRIGPEAPLVKGVADAVRQAGIPASAPAPRAPNSRAPSASPRSSWFAPASPPQRTDPSPTKGVRARLRARAGRPGGRQGRRPGRRQGRRCRAHARRGPAGRARVLRRGVRRRGQHGGHRGDAHRSRVHAARLHGRQDRPPHGHLPGSQARP